MKNKHKNTEEGTIGNLKAQVATLRDTCERKGKQIEKLRAKNQKWEALRQAAWEAYNEERRLSVQRKHKNEDLQVQVDALLGKKERRDAMLREKDRTLKLLRTFSTFLALLVFFVILLLASWTGTAKAGEREQGTKLSFSVPCYIHASLDGTLTQGCTVIRTETMKPLPLHYFSGMFCGDGYFWWDMSWRDNENSLTTYARQGRVGR